MTGNFDPGGTATVAREPLATRLMGFSLRRRRDLEHAERIAAVRVAEVDSRSEEAYVATNPIRHLDELHSSDFVTWTPVFRSQSLNGLFSAVSTPIFAIKYSLASS